jgi:hypothetical protein
METRSGRLALVINEDPDRIESIARAVRSIAPEVEVIVHDTAEKDEVTALLAISHAAGAGRTVVIIRASPASWTTAAILAILRPPHYHGAVDAMVIAEGPPELLPVFITDFPGLRLLSPHSHTSAKIADLLVADDLRNQAPA